MTQSKYFEYFFVRLLTTLSEWRKDDALGKDIHKEVWRH